MARGKSVEELLGSPIKAKVTLIRYIYPTSWREPQWGIARVHIKELVEGELPEELTWAEDITVKGTLPVMVPREEYVLNGVLVNDDKYGPQYNISSLRGDYNFANAEDRFQFLKFTLGESQAQKMCDACEDPIKLLREKDIKSLMKIPGIGHITAQKAIDKFMQTEEYADAIIAFANYHLTNKAIMKIVKAFGSAEAAVSAIQKNPYILIEKVRGYGWRKADRWAAQAGIKGNDPRRARAYACHYLDERGETNGDSWVVIDDLLSAVQAMCAPMDDELVVSTIKSLIRTEDKPNEPLYYEPDTRRVSLVENYEIERDLGENLRRLMKGEPYVQFSPEEVENYIKRAEEEIGFEYTEEQRQAIRTSIANPVSVITGKAGCVDCDTEYFNGSEWKKISEYTDDEQVLIYHPDGTASLEKPERYIKLPETQLWEVETKYGLSMCLCPEHNVYYITSKGNLYHKTFAEVMEDHNKTYHGFNGRFITSFSYGATGIDLTDEEIKIMLMVIAEGHFPCAVTNRCTVRLKKERKIVEIRKILKEWGQPYKEYAPDKNGFSVFTFYAPRREKEFTTYWYNCSHEQLQLICDNVLKWDGSLSHGRRFSTTSLQSANFVQFAFAACNCKAVIQVRDRRGTRKNSKYERKSIEYDLFITDRNLISMGGFHKENSANKTKIVPYPTKDGYKYCFTVSSHMWIMRRHGKIVISGNCGKSFSTSAVYKIFESKQLRIATCALSGRASSKLTEITHRPGQTIHKLLGARGKNEFQHDKDHPLELDVLIIDECTLIGADIFLALLQAVKTGTRVIMLGDTHQLEPIGLGNVFADIIKSGKIPVSTLTKIHRQAAASGIITESLKVSNGEQLFDSGFCGEEIRGERKDFKLDIVHDNALVYQNIINEFNALREQGVNADDIQILVPIKERGNVCCKILNNHLQMLINPTKYPEQVEVDSNPERDDSGKAIPGTGTKITLKPNDRIIVMQNDYKSAKDMVGHETPIFNGNVGYIKTIRGDNMYINLTEQGDLILPKKAWPTLSLGYAITVHKKQGDSSPYVIFGLDSTAYALLSKELLYTAITRARKYCVIVAANSVFRRAVTISRVRIKQTWLQFLL